MVGTSLIILKKREFLLLFLLEKFFLHTDKNPWNPDKNKTKINFIINQKENIKESS